MVAYSRLIPVFVVTGFLGSGKTTLLNHMLRHPSLKDAAVLINEFGAVGLDHFLVKKMDENTVLLSSGCLCCTIRDDLKSAILELNSKRERGEVPRYKRMVVETTGLADPTPILFTLMSDTVLRYHYRLGGVITTVDAVNGMEQLDRHVESVRQATVADRIVITKSDLVAPSQVEALKARLMRINPSADYMIGRFGRIDVRRVLRADVYDPSRKAAEVKHWLDLEALKAAAAPHGHDEHPHDVNRHDEHIRSFVVTIDEPLDWTAFGIWLTMLLHRHGQRVLRVKGILNVKGAAAPVVINGVQHVVHPPMHLAAWPDDERRSRIVFIVDDLDPALIERSLAAFNRIGAAAA
ncbi:MAG: GTP-binding protein [Alphaproteobacteria bacterium]